MVNIERSHILRIRARIPREPKRRSAWAHSQAGAARQMKRVNLRRRSRGTLSARRAAEVRAARELLFFCKSGGIGEFPFMNRLRRRVSRRLLDHALVLGALCVAACTTQNPDQNDGGDAAPTADVGPADSNIPDGAPADSAPVEASPDTKTPSAGDSSSDSSSGSDSSVADVSSRTEASSGSDGSMDASVDATADTGGNTGSDSAVDSGIDAGNEASTCVKGMTSPNQVVMLGDSYLDPLFSAAGTDIVADAQNAGALATNMTYRHYYQGGAAMNGGAGPLNIPYQYRMMAMMDPTVQNPSNIDTVIMDGGQSDFLLGDRSCLYVPPVYSDGGADNPNCYNTIQGVMNQLTSLMQQMAQNGVKHIVYFFYPHLDPSGGGLLTAPAPAVNQTIDYAASLAQTVCESVSQCVFVDSRPAFDGHVAQYISGDQVNPSAAGAQVLADLVWRTMISHCIAQ
jgi:hypothetical protein